MSFWANNDGAGYVRLKKVASGNFIVFEPDFGKSISQAFFFQTNVVSVDEPEVALDPQLRAFPNPATDVVQVQWDALFQPERYVLRDVRGTLVREGAVRPGDSGLTLPVTGLAPGTYHIEVVGATGGDGTWIQVN